MNLVSKLFTKIRTIYFPTQHQKMVNKFFSDGGESKFRYNYKLNENSVVFDIGGFEGQWASDIFSRYQPSIYIFEPVKSFFLQIRERFRHNHKIEVLNFGVGASKREESIVLSQDGSSTFIKGENVEKIIIIDFIDYITEQKIQKIDLIKINIEGGEYEVLERMINSGFIVNIDNLQIQFHDSFPDAKAKMLKIQEQLAKTHKLTYQYLFVWENWERIND